MLGFFRLYLNAMEILNIIQPNVRNMSLEFNIVTVHSFAKFSVVKTNISINQFDVIDLLETFIDSYAPTGNRMLQFVHSRTPIQYKTNRGVYLL